jgi:hypothetical protein
LEHEIIVADNGSTDGSREMCRMRFPEVKVLDNGANLGFAAANNRGFAVATGETVLLLNSDTRVLPGALAMALEVMEQDPGLGGLGCKLLTADGGVQRSVEGASGFGASLRHHLRLGTPAHKRREYYDAEHADVEYVSGAFLLLRRSALDASGGFDEQFFMYAEEADLCLRLRQAGWRIGYTARARIVHLGGASAARPAARSVQRVVSRLRFLKKHRGSVYFQLFRAFTLAHALGAYLTGRLERAALGRYVRACRTLRYSN